MRLQGCVSPTLALHNLAQSSCRRVSLTQGSQDMWKAFVILSCLCAIAQAQRQTRPSEPAPTNYEPEDVVVDNSYGSASSSRPGSNYACKEKNERYPISGTCDRYVECLNGTSEEKLCPDGLRFNPNLSFIAYPCVYPNEYNCLERSSLQPAQPTDQCPNQFGYFKLGDSQNCSWFRNCVNGVGYDITCPEGLAFDSQTYRCNWADEVSDCDVNAFIGFTCPEPKISDEFSLPGSYRFFKSDADCQKYFLCIGNKPRLLRCGGEAAFDALTNSCVSADQVESCPSELKSSAKLSKEHEQLLAEKEQEFAENPPLLKKRLL